MTAPGTRVEGDRELARTLGNLADDLTDMDQASRGAATVVAIRGRTNAPVVTGALAGSVQAQPGGQGEAVVASHLIYAGVINNGWPGHNIRANPFLTDALEDTRAQWLPLYEAEVNQAVGRVRGA